MDHLQDSGLITIGDGCTDKVFFLKKEFFKGFFRVAMVSLCLTALGNSADTEIVEAHLEALGGRDAIESIKTVQRKGEIKISGSFGNFKGKYRTAAVLGQKAYSRSNFRLWKETEAWNGLVTWKDDAETGPQLLAGKEAEVVQSAAYLNPIHALMEQTDSGGFDLVGEETYNKELCHVLKGPGGDEEFLISKASQLLLGIRAKIYEPSLEKEVDFTNTYSHFNNYSGVTLPDREVMDFGNGEIVVTVKYDSTILNEEIDGAIFEPPKDLKAEG